MYFKLSSSIIFREFDSFGYITDNRNFRYKLLNDGESPIGDRIVSDVGCIFISALTKKPQFIDDIVKKICICFTDVDFNIIKADVCDFLQKLNKDGFIVAGRTYQECEENEIKFSYKKTNIENKVVKTHPCVFNVKKETQDFLDNYFDGKPQLTNVHIEIISKCNERCVHCYIPHENKTTEMSYELFYNILNQCRELNVLHINLSGGEPLLHKDFCNFLRKCNDNNFSVNVLSNLTLLNDDILAEMKSNPLLGVQVSLYSMNPTIHDEITQIKGSFEKTKNGILRLIENDIPLQISCPIIKQNKDSYTDVIKWAEKYGIQVSADYVIIAGYNNTTSNLKCRLFIDEVKEIISYKMENDSKFLRQMKQDVEDKKNTLPNDSICSVCHSSICINDNGDVYPCAGWQGYVVGNIKNTSLEEIWEESDKVRYLRDLQKKDFPKCINCSDRDFCTMCMIRNSNEDPLGNPLIINKYFCTIAKIKKELFNDKTSKKNDIVINETNKKEKEK
ncbi:radical SAM/SPASM domain-containing protein [Treponema brennaborense]|uniref:Radical SAM domain protein n=1 Tax=Treponema brennaborense (strain DSM 12168 / CIP 105900 / DD5/3) TaxID=906968 RepID=F4LNJ8_TREBD|nr:radical SAM protein [Treponema brennaborense]AEE15852.1 Radical SAM domain protein [Treponema brennaborense DSM 12168]